MHHHLTPHLRSVTLAALALVLVAALTACGASHASGAHTAGTLPINDPAGYVPIPDRGAPATTPIDPRLASFCHGFYVFLLQVDAVNPDLHAGDLAGAKHSFGTSNDALQRVSGVAPDAIASPVQQMAAAFQAEAAALEAASSVTSFSDVVGPLAGRIYQPYVTSVGWFTTNCLRVIFAPGQQGATTTTAPSATTAPLGRGPASATHEAAAP